MASGNSWSISLENCYVILFRPRRNETETLDGAAPRSRPHELQDNEFNEKPQWKQRGGDEKIYYRLCCAVPGGATTHL